MKHRELWLLITFTLIVRGGVLWASFDSLQADPDAYRQLAVNIIEHGTLGVGDQPSAFRPPLYPILLVPCIVVGGTDPLGIAVLHVVLGTATVALTWGIGVRWHLGRWALLAALLVAIDPILLRQSTLVMTETLATFATTLALFLLTTTQGESYSGGRMFAGGCAIGVATLTRPTFLLWAALGVAAVLLAALFQQGTLLDRFKQQFRQAALVAAGVAVLLAPWAMRNMLALGSPELATTHGGFTLLLANNPSFYTYLQEAPPGEVWDATAFNAEQVQRLPRRSPAEELDSNRRAYQQAWQHIGDMPEMFVRACFVRLGRFWGLLPHQVVERESSLRRASRYAIGAWYLVVSVLAVIGAVSSWRRLIALPWVWATLLVLSLSVVHACYWSNLRMRAPVVPIVCLWAAGGCGVIVHRGCGVKSSSESNLHG